MGEVEQRFRDIRETRAEALSPAALQRWYVAWTWQLGAREPTAEEREQRIAELVASAEEGVWWARRNGLPWLVEQAALELDVARLGLAWIQIGEVGYRLLGPAAMIGAPGSAPLGALDPAAEDPHCYRFDARSRLGKRTFSEAERDDASRFVYLRDDDTRPDRGRLRLERWALLGDYVVDVYEMIVQRVEGERKVWSTVDQVREVRPTLKREALALTARITNYVWGATLSRPLGADDVKARLQQRGRGARQNT